MTEQGGVKVCVMQRPIKIYPVHRWPQWRLWPKTMPPLFHDVAVALQRLLQRPEENAHGIANEAFHTTLLSFFCLPLY